MILDKDDMLPDTSLDYLKIKEYKLGNPATYNFAKREYPNLEGEITVIEVGF